MAWTEWEEAKAAAEFTDVVTEARSVHRVLQDSHDDLKKHKEDLRTAVDRWAKRDVHINEDGGAVGSVPSGAAAGTAKIDPATQEEVDSAAAEVGRILSAANETDLIGRSFTATATKTKYVGDITHLPIDGGKFRYLATVIDLASRRLAGWAIADHMRTGLVTDALAAAIRTRGSLTGSITHTDHGAQYTSRAFAEACRSAGVRRSMSAVGSSADNALAESFNATFKRETLQGRKSWPDAREARLDAFRWLNRYNTRRRHPHLGERSPTAVENTLQPTPTTLAPAA